MKSIPLTLALIFLGATPSAALTIARDGASPYVILIPDAATLPEQTAAETLADYLSQVTGAQLPIQRESDTRDSSAPVISVGRTKLARKTLADVKWDDLAQDGIVLRTAGSELFLAGGSPRGTVYAVDAFLEDAIGVRWWTSDESTVPRRPTLEIPDQRRVYIPKLAYREAYHHDATGPGPRALFASRLKLNGHHHAIPPERGGRQSIIGWCHTSFALVPPSVHFAQHPEWFAMIGGKRQTATQLCLSNPEMRKALIADALERVRAQHDAGIISITQNDGYGPCECDQCQAIVAEEGSESGPWIRLCNEAAAAINEEYPGFLVETLAYVYSRQPPRLVQPSPNVLVRLCSIEADFAHPLSRDSFGHDLRGWSRIAPNLFVWNYVTNFRNFLVPHPNFNAIGDDLRFFVDHNVVGVFQQGNNFNARAGDMLPLRLWVEAHLMWDPTRDQRALTQEFLKGYYDPAGPRLAQYMDVVNSISGNPDARIHCGNDNLDYLTPKLLAECNRLFDEAEKSVAGDPVLAKRVKRERLALEHVNLLRYDFAAEKAAQDGDASAANAAYRRRVRAWAAAARAAGVENYSEMQSVESYVPTLEIRGENLAPSELPAPGAPLAAGEFDIQQDRFTLYQPPAKSALADDPDASDGKAASMPGHQSDWAIQFHVAREPALAAAGPWISYLVVRCPNAAATAGNAFMYGLYGPRGMTFLDWAKLETAGDGEYHAYPIPVERFDPGSYFFVAPLDNPQAVPAIHVDRIFIRKSPNAPP